MAKCVCEPEIWRTSYENVKEQVRLLHSDWSDIAIKQETAQRFRPRYRADVASIQQENGDSAEYQAKNGGFTLNQQGEMVYTEGGFAGETLEGLHLNQKKLRPQEYSLSDHQTSLSIQEAFRNGATEVITSYHRPGEDHTDILVMRYDPVTKVGTTYIISDKERTHSFTEIIQIAKSRFSDLQTIKTSDKSFVLTDKIVKADRIHDRINNGNKIGERSKLFSRNLSLQDSDVSRGEALPARLASAERAGRQESWIRSPRPDQIGTRDDTKAKFIAKREQKSLLRNKILPEKRAEKIGSSLLPLEERKPVRKVSKKELVQRIKKAKIALRVIRFATETKVGIGAAIYNIGLLARQPELKLTKRERKKERKKLMQRLLKERSLKEKKKVLKEKRRLAEAKPKVIFVYEKKTLKRKEKKSRNLKEHIRFLPAGRQGLSINRLPAMTSTREIPRHVSLRSRRKSSSTLMPGEAILNIHKRLPRPRRRVGGLAMTLESSIFHPEQPKKEEQLKRKQVVYLIQLLKMQMRKLQASDRAITCEQLKRMPIRLVKKENHNKVKSKEIKPINKLGKEKLIENNQRVRLFTVALLTWLLIRWNQESKVTKRENKQSESKVKKVLKEKSVQHEQTPWLLLSIIWYLVQIREQGMVQFQNKKQKKIKTKKSGVIFTFQQTGAKFGSIFVL